MGLIINDEELRIEDVQEINYKVRALLFDDNNNILIAKYGEVLLFPGGSIDQDEFIGNSLIRELIEETGVEYKLDEFMLLNTLNHFQKNYIKRDGEICNRLINTYYYIGKYKGLGKQFLTEKEMKDSFRLELVPFDSLEELVLNNKNKNPRNKYFIEELLTIISFYKETFMKDDVNKLIFK